jgi:hypothetical protein
MKNTVLWDMTPCSLAESLFCLLMSKDGAVGFCKMFGGFYQPTQCHVPGGILHSKCCEKFAGHIRLVMLL